MSRNQTKSKEKSLQALNLRIKGYNYGEIATEIGYANASSAHRAVQRELTKVCQEKAAELITLSTLELDKLKAAYEKAAYEDGDKQAARLLMEIFDRRAKLLSLLPKEQIEVTHKTEVCVDWDGTQQEDEDNEN